MAHTFSVQEQPPGSLSSYLCHQYVSSFPQFAHAPGAAPQGTGGTWWYVPAQKQKHQYTTDTPASPLTHPAPPVKRADHLMWVGNVPTDAVDDELWRFFTQLADGAGGNTTHQSVAPPGGVLSICLMRHSRCAFVSYETEVYLEAAIARFDGVAMRADRLVCRVCRRADDLVFVHPELEEEKEVRAHYTECCISEQ